VPREERRKHSYQVLETRTGSEIEDLKRELVLQLYLQDGPFWEAVHTVRSRWDIKPVHSFPPQPLLQELLPPGLPYQPPQPSLEKEYAAWLDTYERWVADLESIARSDIPPIYIGERFRPDWGDFISVCVLFQPSVPGDPSAPKLLEFAELGGPEAESLPLKPEEDYPGGPLMAVKPPIKVMSDPAEELRIETQYWRRVLQGIWELYLKPLGVTLDSVRAEVHEAYPEIEQERSDSLGRNRSTETYWIKVDEYVRKKDLDPYFRMIAEGQKSRPSSGARPVHSLLHAECAVLHVEHGWDEDRLAAYYGKSRDTILKYIKWGKVRLNSA